MFEALLVRMTVCRRVIYAAIVYLMCLSVWEQSGARAMPSKSPVIGISALIGWGGRSARYVFLEICNRDQVAALSRLESMIHWIEGPFVNNVEYEHQCLEKWSVSLPSVRLFDSVSNTHEYVTLPDQVVSNAVALRNFIDDRHQLNVEFSLSSDAGESVELRWVHFRGNLKLVSLGSGDGHDGALVIHPGQSTKQFTRGGHMFVALSLTPSDPTANEVTIVGAKGQYPEHPEFAVLEHHMQRVIGVYLMPSIYQDCVDSVDCTLSVNIGRGDSALYNLQKAVPDTACTAPQRDLSFSNRPSADFNACYRELLMKYWEQQRLSQVYVNTWAVPAIPLANPTGTSVGGNHIDALWTLFDIDPALTTSLLVYHRAHRLSQGSVPEPPISLVFNQFEVPTWYVPLPAHLLDAVVEEVRRAAAVWLGMSPEDLLLTGAYGSREYGHGAVVRWHVDPVHSHITAIVHLAEEYSSGVSGSCNDQFGRQECDAKCGEQADAWAIQIPKSIDTYRNYTDYPNAECSDELHHVHLRVGQVLLLQSAKLPHARVAPFPGEWYANAFVHFAPVGWEQREEVQLLS